MPRCSRCTFAVLLPFLLTFAVGCDTDNPGTPTEELAGIYDFAELRFDPSAQAIADADVAAELVASETEVRLRGSGQAILFFQLQGQPSDLANATFSATNATARLVASTEADAQRLAALLLPSTLTLARSADDQRLTAELLTTVNLQAFDPQNYSGLTAVAGTLFVTLVRRAE